VDVTYRVMHWTTGNRPGEPGRCERGGCYDV